MWKSTMRQTSINCFTVANKERGFTKVLFGDLGDLRGSGVRKTVCGWVTQEISIAILTSERNWLFDTQIRDKAGEVCDGVPIWKKAVRDLMSWTLELGGMANCLEPDSYSGTDVYVGRIIGLCTYSEQW